LDPDYLGDPYAASHGCLPGCWTYRAAMARR
jgi:hypothetical protein